MQRDKRILGRERERAGYGKKKDIEKKPDQKSTGDSRENERETPDKQSDTEGDEVGRKVTRGEEREMRGERADVSQTGTFLHELDPAKLKKKKTLTDEEKVPPY